MSDMCRTKRAWPTADLARGHMLLLLQAGRCDPETIHVYRCPLCAGWHVGHGQQKHWRTRNESAISQEAE